MRTQKHEAGHAIQNITPGVVMPFIIYIPCAVRYWCHVYIERKGHSVTLSLYDSIWFEGWAFQLGEKYFN